MKSELHSCSACRQLTSPPAPMCHPAGWDTTLPACANYTGSGQSCTLAPVGDASYNGSYYVSSVRQGWGRLYGVQRAALQKAGCVGRLTCRRTAPHQPWLGGLFQSKVSVNSLIGMHEQKRHEVR